MITQPLDEIAVGDRHISRARTITETDLVTFAMFTGDWHPIHTDVQYAEADPRFHGSGSPTARWCCRWRSGWWSSTRRR